MNYAHIVGWLFVGACLVGTFWAASFADKRYETLSRTCGVLTLVMLAVLLTGCGGRAALPVPEPVIVVTEVKVPTPVPCRALAQLGVEPNYPDTVAAIGSAQDIFKQAQLLSQGRLMRVRRLAEYEIAKLACTF